MVHTDDRFSAAVEAAVAEVEALTDAELVVVASPRSGSYRDLAWLGGAVAGVLLLAFLCWSPWVFQAIWFPIDVAMAVWLVGWALDRWPTRWLRFVPAERRRRQVREAAEAAFVQEAVHATAGRTGLLVYVSAIEGDVVLLPDQGLLGRIPGSEWNALRVGARTVDELVAGLHAVGALLAKHVPPTGANPDEIANAPRVRA